MLPTPGVAARGRARARLPGAVISASHNPFGDNGIKLFSLVGHEAARRRRGRRSRASSTASWPTPTARRGAPPGTAWAGSRRTPSAVDVYGEHLLAATEGRRLDGLRIVVDCANGAASAIAPGVLGRARRAWVTALHDRPTGTNINEQVRLDGPGRALRRRWSEHRADLGLALDGDADRVIAVDHTGSIVDGDVLLALFALDLAERGRLAGNTVVVTVMTNLGLPPGHGGPRHRRRARPTWATATCWPPSTPTG